MARTKSEKIPARDEYLPDAPEAELESMIAVIPSCKEIPKKLLILTASSGWSRPERRVPLG